MDEQGIPFVREYFLRLLKIKSSRPEHLAEYFDFSVRETDIALQDLLDHKWVKWNQDGTVGLSQEGHALFNVYSGEPSIPSLKQSSTICNVEFIGKNFVNKSSVLDHSKYSLELNVPIQDLSVSKEVVKKQFPIDFISLIESKTVNVLSNDAELYKVDLVEQYRIDYFRVTQPFELAASDGYQIERSDIDVLKSEPIDLCITERIVSLKAKKSNLKEIMKAMSQFKDEDTRCVISNERLSVSNFIELQERTEKTYFLGQICHQNSVIKRILEVTRDVESVNPLMWLAPNDIYWGKQIKLIDMLDMMSEGALVTKDNEKYRLYDFRLYLPLPEHSDSLRYDVNELDYQFKSVANKNIFCYKEGFLDGNVEVIVLQNKFAIVCYHIKLPAYYDVPLPIGFMTTDMNEVNQIYKVVSGYLNAPIVDEKSHFQTNDFGAMSLIKK